MSEKSISLKMPLEYLWKSTSKGMVVNPILSYSFFGYLVMKSENLEDLITLPKDYRELADVVNIWDSLPEEEKEAIHAIVKKNSKNDRSLQV